MLGEMSWSGITAPSFSVHQGLAAAKAGLPVRGVQWRVSLSLRIESNSSESKTESRKWRTWQYTLSNKQS